jgi:hypothetical protein
MRSAAALVVALVVACAGVLAGCSSQLGIGPPALVGPLFDAAKPTILCLSAARGEPVAVGWDLLENDETNGPPARIVSVGLAQASGLRLVGVLAVPVQSDQQLGSGWSYPLTGRQVGEIPKGVEWSRRRPAAGAVITAGPAGAATNVVAGVSTTGAGAGTASGLTVTYLAGGRRFVLQLPTSMRVENLPSHC